MTYREVREQDLEIGWVHPPCTLGGTARCQNRPWRSGEGDLEGWKWDADVPGVLPRGTRFGPGNTDQATWMRWISYIDLPNQLCRAIT